MNIHLVRMTETGARWNGSTIIAIDKIELDTLYSITINPNDDYQYWNNLDRVEALEAYMNKNLLCLFMGDIKVHMEVSSTGRLHFHGTIKWKSYEFIKMFFIGNIHKILDRVHLNIDTMKDEDVWDTYCCKQSNYKLPILSYKGRITVRTTNGKVKFKTFDEI